MQELEATRSALASKEEELYVKVVKRENRKRRKVIEAYQDMMNAGAAGLHAVSLYMNKVFMLLVDRTYNSTGPTEVQD